MSHSYYDDEVKMNNLARLEYFDNQFKTLANMMASEKGLTLSAYLSDITSFFSFKAKLEEVFSLDNSLANYVSGMNNNSLRLFYNRPLIQEIVNTNREEEQIEIEVPLKVEQVEKETRSFFRTTFTEKDTGKIIKVVAYKDEVIVKGKKQIRFRDSKGRFTKKI